MAETIFVVQGFLGGRKLAPQLFETEAQARARAVYLGQGLDGVMLWRQAAEQFGGRRNSMQAMSRCCLHEAATTVSVQEICRANDLRSVAISQGNCLSESGR